MHYYQFNIGDYASHTSRLSPLEDLAYRRLLDLYYLNEHPFNGCSTDVARDIGMTDNQKEVDYILSKFFPKDVDLWVNKRADLEIEAYKNRKESASKAGKASAKARKAKPSKRQPNDRSTNVQRNGNDRSTKHKPITNNQEPIQYDAIRDRYNEILGEKIAAIKSLTDQRKKHIKARISEDAKREDVDWWVKYFTYICEQCPHLTGNSGENPSTGRVWAANFDWLINPNNMVKVIEGNYEQR